MTSTKINEFSEKFGKDVSKKQLSDLENKLKNSDEETFEKIGSTKVKSTFVTVMLSAFLGLFGSGSFYLGRIKAGILKVVFNVVVPLTAIILFLVWLAPANKLYYNQSFDVARSIYSIMGTEDEYEGYTHHILVVAPWTIERADNIKSAINIKNGEKDKDGTIVAACKTVTSAEEITITGLEDAAAVKTVLDDMDFDFDEVTVKNKTVSVKIDFGELPEFKVSELDSFGAKFTAINANASELLEKINQVMPAGEDLTDGEQELKSALSTINFTVKNMQSELAKFLNDNSTDSLSKCISRIKADITYFSNDLKEDLENYTTNTKLEKSVEKKLNFNERFSSIFAHLNNVPNKDDLYELHTEISTARTEINSLSAKAIDAAKTYYLNGEYATWLPGTFLMIDGIIILCWWIGEVFNDREKCQKYNYEKLVEAIQ